jgi:hypothetical protein
MPTQDTAMRFLHATALLACAVMLAAPLAAGDALGEALNPVGARWERGDNVAFVGDHRGSAGNYPWMDRMLWKLRNLPPVGIVRAAWAGCDTAASLPATYDMKRVALDWSVVVMMYGAFDAQLEKPTEPAAFAQSLGRAVTAMRQDGVIIVLATPMPCGDKKAGNPLDERLNAYADAIREIGNGDGITLVDLRRDAAAWLAEKNPEDKPEGILSVQNAEKRWALTDQGHAFVAERMAAAIGRALQSAPPQLADLPPALIGDTEIVLRARRVLPGTEVQFRYALDGKDPAGKDGKPYKEPFKLRKAESITVSIAEGDRTTIASHRFVRDKEVSLRSADRVPSTAPGLKVEIWPGRHDKLPDFLSLGVAGTLGVCCAPDAAFVADPMAPLVPDEYYAMRLSGFVEVPRDGWYIFHLGSDDASRMLLGDEVLIDNDGMHGATYKSAGTALKQGRHAITIHYVQGNGGRALRLLYEGPGIRRTEVPDAAFSHDPKAKPPVPPKPAPTPKR